jgi:membrane protease YdiL (CAAX protease family)
MHYTAGSESIPAAADSVRLWGIKGTLLWVQAIILLYFLVQISTALAVSIYVEGLGTDELLDRFASGGGFTGFSFSLSLLAAAFLGILACLQLIRFREASVADYLSLSPASVRQIAFWILLTAALAVFFELVSGALGRHGSNDIWLETYMTARFKPLFLLSIILVGPVFEEAVFRGFMQRGLEASRMGSRWAIVLTALFWAAIHLQYDLFDMLNIFVLGLLLGTARARTGSLYVTVAMHVFNNLSSVLLLQLSLSGAGI